MTLVVSLKDVLVDDEAEEHNGLLEDSFYFVVCFLYEKGSAQSVREYSAGTYTLEAFLQIIVNEQGYVFLRFRVDVDKALECLIGAEFRNEL